MHDNSAFLGAHQDVLEAPVPEQAEERIRLQQECKNRATAAVQAQAWPDAVALYDKAVECCANDKAQAAILHANLSLVHGKMHQWDAALRSAETATQENPTYTKGWWRLGQAKAALEDWQGAVQALQEAVRLEPNNKALAKELSKMQQAAAANNKTASSGSTTTSSSAPKPAAKPAPAEPPTSAPKSSSTTESSSSHVVHDNEDETTFTPSDHVKGYKIVNGKKTSYFHHELSQDAAQLIGDIAPKKLETVPQQTLQTTAQAGTSAWNQAGTWEEKDVSQTACQTLQQQLEQATYTLPESSAAPNAVVNVSKANVSGHASVATVRGKKRYIYEFSLQVDWEFQHDETKATGTMTFPDVDGTCVVGEPYDVSRFTVTHMDDASVRPVLEQFVHQHGLRDVLHAKIDEWVGLFKETY